MNLESEIARKIYIKLWKQKTDLTKEINDLKYKLRDLEAAWEETILELDSIASIICMRCQGQGELRISYAQDETRFEECKACKGTGLRKGLR